MTWAEVEAMLDVEVAKNGGCPPVSVRVRYSPETVMGRDFMYRLISHALVEQEER